MQQQHDILYNICMRVFRKSSIRIQVFVDSPLFDEIEKYKVELGITRSEYMRIALHRFGQHIETMLELHPSIVGAAAKKPL